MVVVRRWLLTQVFNAAGKRERERDRQREREKEREREGQLTSLLLDSV